MNKVDATTRSLIEESVKQGGKHLSQLAKAVLSLTKVQNKVDQMIDTMDQHKTGEGYRSG